MAVIFNQSVRHDRLEFLPGVPLGFEDPDADTYFVNAGWASSTSETPVRVYSQDEVSIDPETRSADTGKLIIGGGE